MATFENPNSDTIRRILQDSSVIAMVGMSPKLERDSNAVAQALMQFGYKVIPVRPHTKEILDQKAYPDILSLPEVPDVVDVFRAPQYVDEIVDQCIAKGVKVLWLQEGVINEEAALRAQEAGITVVMDRCMYKEWVTLLGGATP